MKRKLFRQTANEWQHNVWLALELLIVSVVMWFISDYLYTNISIVTSPRGFDTEHCYLIKYAELNDKSPDYISGLSDEQRNDNLLRLIDLLRKRPEIDCVAMGQNSYFYNGSNSGIQLEKDSLSTGDSYFLYRLVSADFPRVFRIRGANGESPEDLAEILKNGPRSAFLISDNAFEDHGIGHMKEFIGSDFYSVTHRDTLTLLASYAPARYNDYTPEEHSGSAMMCTSPRHYIYLNEMVVRVRDNMDRGFIENLMKDASKTLRSGNHYISGVQSFDDIRAIHQREYDADLRYYFIGAAFLALNIFLGLFGTFWFRTQQRVPEIAIRKANGATRGDIFRRIVSEGELILLAVTPVAILIDWQLTKMELNTYYQGSYFDPLRFFSCVAVAWGLMALMILLGTIIPANRAMKIAPAEALNEE